MQRFESLHVHDTARKQSSILTYFLSFIAFKTYESQYSTKYSIRFTQRLIEGKNLEFSAIFNFFTGPVGVRDSECPL